MTTCGIANAHIAAKVQEWIPRTMDVSTIASCSKEPMGYASLSSWLCRGRSALKKILPNLQGNKKIQCSNVYVSEPVQGSCVHALLPTPDELAQMQELLLEHTEICLSICQSSAHNSKALRLPLCEAKDLSPLTTYTSGDKTNTLQM